MLPPAVIAAGTPRVLWVELTSKCPFDCIFCSRKLLRGNGEHMRLSLFLRLLRQLDRPDILRLNYSGESIHYPHLIEAIEAAKAVGATVELVTAFSSAPDVLIRDLVDKGLDRLTISVHTTDEAQYTGLYRFSSFEALRQKVRLLHSYLLQTGSSRPQISFAFVAMESNLSQLPAVAAFAAEYSTELSIHPVIRRDPILTQFPAELHPGGAVRQDFMDRLASAVTTASTAFPALAIQVARPSGTARIHAPGPVTCEQNPWETAHVLANGDVVPCEVQDKTVLGNLEAQTLEQIWLGDSYQRFREKYNSGTLAPCLDCAWRKTASQFTWGWHEAHRESVVWSRRQSVLTLPNSCGKTALRMTGMLPPARREENGNRLTISAHGKVIGAVENNSSEMQPFTLRLALAPSEEQSVALRFDIDSLFCPDREGVGTDTRALGFALTGAELVKDRERALNSLFSALRTVDRLTGKATFRRLPSTPKQWKPGVSIVIPERGNPEILRECLEALEPALARVAEPVETYVIVNGSSAAIYAGLQSRFTWASFQFCPRPLGFSEAVRRGLAWVRHDWVYLLNSDMTLHPDALEEIMRLRAPEVFSIGSQIFLRNKHERRVETNFNRMILRNGIVELQDAEPPPASVPAASLYGGGGSSLFQTRLLRSLIGPASVYDPFYFEDAEWGVIALRHGYANVFCPASRVTHRRRATVGKFYNEAEVDRIFKRNQFIFQMRNLREGLDAVYVAMHEADPQTIDEILSPLRALAIVSGRLRSSLYPVSEQAALNFALSATDGTSA